MKVAPAVSSDQPMFLEQLEDRRMMSVGAIINKGAVRLETSLGRITLLLTPDVTPLTVQNFLQNYVTTGLYNNTIVHRSVPGFIIQLGGYKLTSNFPHIKEAAPVPNEFADDLAAAEKAGGTEVNVRGTVAMAKLGSNPDSATSEFFINLADNASNLDGQNGGFTTFATVIGGGMHVADAIAALKTTDDSSENTAFSDLPVIKTTSSSQNPVVITSAKQQRVLPVKLDSSTKTVTWVDEKGGTATITLSKAGTADLTFVGGNDMTYQSVGNRVIIHGTGVDLEQIITHKTTKGSSINIASAGGHGPAHIGSIIVDGGSLASINGSSIEVDGDITASSGSIGSINLRGTYRTTISTKTGQMSLHIGSTIDTSINTGGVIKSLVATDWSDDGELPTSITAKQINSIYINGNFSSNITTTKGSLQSLTILGNVGTQGDSTWTIAGNLNTVNVGKISGLTANVTGNISHFTAREVLANINSGTTTTISAGAIGTMSLATLTNNSSISSNGGINSIFVAGAVDSSTIRATKNIGSINVGSLTGTLSNSATTPITLRQSLIYAGVASSLTSGIATEKSDFITGSGVSIGRVIVRGDFSNTSISAPVIGPVNLGKINTINAKLTFGVSAEKRIAQLVGTTQNSKTIAMPTQTTQSGVINYFSSIGIKGDAINSFTVDIV
ncbi:MAG TPA: peptidylprolyl isomerase [Tepidisphaeraceae bacterium]|jgi:cyclophilin family peptidyl-prolyl cis-trans isomerase|nr:peptidylprolyl isomerase [Tepidisphaeraceae bacterium]